ncbi:SR-related and CTD-associated factor 4 isoform X2 [Oncorhynchus mykiss]|uniref:SR-related and CTD-associated factor 4 isoform X2 n=1 Tax=Oncorhynchus mykiss TaxID=8022 RepID=UPI001877D68F|nr:SR-related and CTD-associated factor 4 isoform X2 [Oncorhynchus mykiss]
MDSVNAFNLELFAMIDMKPPISRAKMMSVTKSAIKAIKLYKHVVQIVEKFIKKCKPELKVPGLYVVDSIVRQSRHQFGVDKDVYGPRFQKNFTPTFQNLYLCPHDDKSKIIRVLNLWQKNAVFEMDVVQPLLDMATGSFVLAPSPQEDLQAQPPVSSASIAAAQHQAQPTVSIAAAQPPVSSAFVAAAQAQPTVSNASIAAAQHQPPVSIAAAQHQPPVSIAAAAQHLAQPPVSIAAAAQPPVSIAAALPQLPPQLRNPEALAAVAQLFQSGQGHELQKMLLRFQPGQQTTTLVPNTVSDQTHSQRVQGQHNTHHPLFNTHHTHPAEQNNSLAKKLLDRFDYDDEPEEVKKEELDSLVPGNVYGAQFPGQTPPNTEQQFQGHTMGQPGRQQTPGEGYPGLNKGYNQSQHTAQQNQDQGNPREREDPSGRRDGREGRQRGHGRRSRSRSGSRSPRRKRSRSNSRSRKPRHSSQRSGSRSRESRWNSPRSRSQERKEREKDKDRRQKGLPSIKSQTLSVCTTTLWVGQLDKKTSRQDVMCLLEEFGQIDSINMIPPRGCAYIVMVHRQDAYRALHKLGRGSFKVNQKAIKIAWALNKGIKATHKKFWDVERGVTYIPWSKVKIEELEGYREGGMLDADTLCPEWGDDVKELTKPGGLNNGGGADAMETEGAATAHVQVTPATGETMKRTTDSRVPMKHSRVPMKHTTDSRVPMKHTTDSRVPMKHTTDCRVPMKHTTDSRDPMKHTTECRVPMKHSRVPMKHTTDSRVPMKHSRVPMKHTTDGTTDSRDPMKHTTDSRVPMKHTTDCRVPMKHTTDSRDPMKRTTDSRVPMKHSRVPMKHTTDSTTDSRDPMKHTTDSITDSRDPMKHHRLQGPNETQQGPNETHHRQQGPNETHHRQQGPNETHHRQQGPNETHHRLQGPNETHHRQQGPNETHHRQQGPNETHHRQQGPNETHHRQQGPNETHHRLQGPNETHHR